MPLVNHLAPADASEPPPPNPKSHWWRRAAIPVAVAAAVLSLRDPHLGDPFLVLAAVALLLDQFGRGGCDPGIG